MSQTLLNDVSGNQLVEQYIGTAYENVKKVAENIPSLNSLLPLMDEPSATNLALLSAELEKINTVAENFPLLVNTDLLVAGLPYEIWKKTNPTGTEAEFLLSLKGTPATTYDSADQIRALADPVTKPVVDLGGIQHGRFVLDITSTLPEDGIGSPKSAGNVIMTSTGIGRYIRITPNRPENFGDRTSVSFLAACEAATHVNLTDGEIYTGGDLLLPDNTKIICPEGMATISVSNGSLTGLHYHRTKTSGLENVIVDISQVSNTTAAILCEGMWYSDFNNFEVIGPDNVSDPFDNTTTNAYGLLLKPVYASAATITNWPIMHQFYDSGLSAGKSISYGTYYNAFRNFHIDGCNVSRLLASKEDGSSSRVNQNLFAAGSNRQAFYSTWHQGCGGGNNDINVSEELIQAGGGGFTCINQSTGTAPVKIGGEINQDEDYQVKGAGLFINIAGLVNPTENVSTSELGTHFRTTPDGITLRGRMPAAADILSDEATLQRKADSHNPIMLQNDSFDALVGDNIIMTRSEMGAYPIMRAVVRSLTGTQRIHMQELEAVGNNTTPTLIPSTSRRGSVNNVDLTWTIIDDNLVLVNSGNTTISVKYIIYKVL